MKNIVLRMLRKEFQAMKGQTTERKEVYNDIAKLSLFRTKKRKLLASLHPKHVLTFCREAKILALSYRKQLAMYQQHLFETEVLSLSGEFINTERLCTRK